MEIEDLVIIILVYALGMLMHVMTIGLMLEGDHWCWPETVISKEDFLKRVLCIIAYPIVWVIALGILIVRIFQYYYQLPDTRTKK